MRDTPFVSTNPILDNNHLVQVISLIISFIPLSSLNRYIIGAKSLKFQLLPKYNGSVESNIYKKCIE